MRLTNKFNMDFAVEMESDTGELMQVPLALECRRMTRDEKQFVFSTDAQGLSLKADDRYDWASKEKNKYDNPDHYVINECVLNLRGKRVEVEKQNKIVPVLIADEEGNESTLTTEQFRHWVYSDPDILTLFLTMYNSRLLTDYAQTIKNS